MDLAHPITSVTTPATGRVLEVLAGTTRPMSASEIHRVMGGMSRAGVRLALIRLADHGIALADVRPSATYYLANREHLAWPAIEQLAGLRHALLDLIEREVATWPIKPGHASLFGSTSRGDGDARSDIDLLIVEPKASMPADANGWQAQIDSLRDLLQRRTGNQVQVLAMSPSRLMDHLRSQDPIVSAWRRDGVLLYGTPLDRLISEAR